MNEDVDGELVGQLPPGWTLEKVAQAAQLKSDRPQLIPLATEVVEEGVDGVRDQVCADLIIRIGDLYLARDPKTGEFLMGTLQGESIVCWAGYGDVLEEALHSL